MNFFHPCISQKEKLMRTNKYLQEVRPLLLILRGLGRFPFLFENGKVVFKPLSWPIWYTIFLIMLQLSATFYILDIIISQLSRRGHIEDSLYCVSLAISLFQSISPPITYCWESSKALRYLDNWYYFQEEFGKSNLDFAYTRLINMVSLMLVIVMILLLVGGAFIFHDFRFVIYSVYVIAFGSLTTNLLLWSATLYELRAATDKLFKRITASGCRNMFLYRILWLKLCNLTTNLGESVGYTGLTTCILLFSTFVLTTYGLLSLAIERSFTKSFFGLLFTSLICMCVQFVMCDAAHRTTQEMTYLLQTMTTNPPVIHFLGYMIIDRNLFLKFISDTVTYLVVLIQLKTS